MASTHSAMRSLAAANRSTIFRAKARREKTLNFLSALGGWLARFPQRARHLLRPPQCGWGRLGLAWCT